MSAHVRAKDGIVTPSVLAWLWVLPLSRSLGAFLLDSPYNASVFLICCLYVRCSLRLAPLLFCVSLWNCTPGSWCRVDRLLESCLGGIHGCTPKLDKSGGYYSNWSCWYCRCNSICLSKLVCCLISFEWKISDWDCHRLVCLRLYTSIWYLNQQWKVLCQG